MFNSEEIAIKEVTTGRVSSGVLLFHLDEISNPEEFTKSISKTLEDDWNEHKLFTSNSALLMTKIFFKQNEESKEFIRSFIKEFLEKTKGKAIEKDHIRNMNQVSLNSRNT